MPLPFLIALGIAYIAVNVAVQMWLGARLGQGRISTRRLAVASTLVRYGPVLVVIAYVAAVGGNWWLILLVGGFAASAFWMLDGLLGYTERIGGLDSMRRLREERDRQRRRPPG